MILSLKGATAQLQARRRPSLAHYGVRRCRPSQPTKTVAFREDHEPGSSASPLSDLENQIVQKKIFPFGSTPTLPSPQHLLASLKTNASEVVGKLLYRYYNWREGTFSDLQLFVVLNGVILALGATLQRRITEMGSSITAVAQDPAAPGWWGDVYSVLVVVLGQDLPEEGSSFVHQAFAVATAILGVASFALVLALVEQVALEVVDGNVRRGSKVYESGHYVVLSWGESARDVSQVTTVLRQLCAASAAAGGAVIVVLIAHREKLEMEALCREAVPPEMRHRSQLVFRQGSPLDPTALKMVNVAAAKSVIITGDYSRAVKDSDAQILRCAVLVDELAAAEGKVWDAEALASSAATSGSRGNKSETHTVHGLKSTQKCDSKFGPWCVAEVQGGNVPALLRYACTDRILPVPTSYINARRYARLLQHPVVATLSHALFDHTSHAQIHLGSFPEATHLIGQRFEDLHAYFPNSLVTGIIDPVTGDCTLNPAPDRTLRAGESLVLRKSASTATPELLPLDSPIPGYHPGARWDPALYSRRSIDEAPLGRDTVAAALSRNFLKDTREKTEDSSSEALQPNRGPRALAPQINASSSSTSSYRNLLRAWKKNETEDPPAPSESDSRHLAAAMLPLPFASEALGPDMGTDLLICGWNGSSAMWELLRELDHGAEALPPGSRITLVNDHPWSDLTRACMLENLKNLRLLHVRADPRNRMALSSALDMRAFRAAIVLHDTNWASFHPGGDAARDASPYALSLDDMLRVDAAVLEVHLNVRYLLEEMRCPDINILAEKITYVGETRFEHRSLLPLGVAVNSSSYAAKVLAQVAVQPGTLTADAEMGRQCEITVQGVEEFAAQGEELSFLQLQARCASVRQVLLGWYRVPATVQEVLHIVVNPEGVEERSKKAVWNDGAARCKLITMAPRKHRHMVC